MIMRVIIVYLRSISVAASPYHGCRGCTLPLLRHVLCFSGSDVGECICIRGAQQCMYLCRTVMG